MPRVRHHTDDTRLAEIQASGAIQASRGWGPFATGVHVEVEPFGRARPGLGGPVTTLGAYLEGAYVEFDAPPGMVTYYCGPRNTAIIPTSEPYPLDGLNPVYVKVRRRWWEFWRTRVD